MNQVKTLKSLKEVQMLIQEKGIKTPKEICENIKMEFKVDGYSYSNRGGVLQYHNGIKPHFTDEQDFITSLFKAAKKGNDINIY